MPAPGPPHAEASSATPSWRLLGWIANHLHQPGHPTPTHDAKRRARPTARTDQLGRQTDGSQRRADGLVRGLVRSAQAQARTMSDPRGDQPLRPTGAGPDRRGSALGGPASPRPRARPPPWAEQLGVGRPHADMIFHGGDACRREAAPGALGDERGGAPRMINDDGHLGGVAVPDDLPTPGEQPGQVGRLRRARLDPQQRQLSDYRHSSIPSKACLSSGESICPGSTALRGVLGGQPAHDRDHAVVERRGIGRRQEPGRSASAWAYASRARWSDAVKRCAT